MTNLKLLNPQPESPSPQRKVEVPRFEVLKEVSQFRGLGFRVAYFPYLFILMPERLFVRYFAGEATDWKVGASEGYDAGLKGEGSGLRACGSTQRIWGL